MKAHWFGVFFYMSTTILTADPKKVYKGYKVLKIDVYNGQEWDKIQTILNNYVSEVDIWREPGLHNPSADIMVSSQEYEQLLSPMEKANISHVVQIQDVENLINWSDKVSSSDNILGHRRRRRSTANSKLSNNIISKYATYDEIKNYISGVSHYFKEIASVKQIGKTYHGEPLLVLKIGIPSNTTKPGIWLDGGMHAREWISPSSVMYVIYQLLGGYYSGDPDVIDLLTDLDWYIMPVANPDGYIFTHVQERLWRKNRAPNPNSTCLGTDLNRNWDFHWGEVYASMEPCKIMYRGRKPTSELETQAISSYILHQKEMLVSYISVHSYGQCWMTRWSYTRDETPDHDELIGLVQKMAHASSNHTGSDSDTKYNAGRSFDFLYAYSGGSADWARGVGGIKYSFVVELRDHGHFGFMLPANYVIPVGKDLWEAVKVAAFHIIDDENLTYSSEFTEDIGDNYVYDDSLTTTPTEHTFYSCPSTGCHTMHTSHICWMILTTFMLYECWERFSYSIQNG